MSQVERVPMAPNGPVFSEMVQGYWRLGDWGISDQQLLSFLNQHIELGITTVDHAHVYGNDPSCEALFGAALKLDPSVRDQIQIVSKCGIELLEGEGKQVNHYDSTPRAIRASVETSLSRLGIDTLDGLLLHRPDWLMDVDAIAEEFDALRDAGKVQHFGVSNFTPSQFSLLQSRLDYPLMTNQVEINPINFEVISDGTLDQLHQLRVRPMAWSCLAGGRIFNLENPQAERLQTTLQDIAEETGIGSIDQIIYAWVMALPCKPVVILGSGNIERIKTAVASLAITLSQEQWYRVWVASMGHNVP